MVKDVVLIVLVSSAIAFIQPRESDLKVSFDPGADRSAPVVYQNKQVHYNRSYAEGSSFPTPSFPSAWQAGANHQPLRLVTVNDPGKNTNNPYYAQSIHNPYAIRQIAP